MLSSLSGMKNCPSLTMLHKSTLRAGNVPTGLNCPAEPGMDPLCKHRPGPSFPARVIL